MPFSVGLRFYRVGIVKNGVKGLINFGNHDPNFDFCQFIRSHLDTVAEFRDVPDIQRSWYPILLESEFENSIYGKIDYGTYGFSSEFVDKKSQESKFLRDPEDVEKIPLYFGLHFPEGENYGVAYFQSFQTRSCKTIVTDSISNCFKEKYPEYRMLFNKLSTQSLENGGLGNADVKQVTLFSKNKMSDIADSYLGKNNVTEHSVEIAIKATRGGTFGKLKSLPKGPDAGIIEYNGDDYEVRKAEISIGGRRRTVSLVGSGSDSGVIDITGLVDFGADGHPLEDSLLKEADSLMDEFLEYLSPQ